MTIVTKLEKEVYDLLIHQLNNYWTDYDAQIINKMVPFALEEMENSYSAVSSDKFYNNNRMVFSPYYSVTWMIFLYRLSYLLGIENNNHEAGIVYYLNKIMHSIDWFYQVKLPVHFMAEHPLGSVLERARYGDYLFVYQGTTVGGNRKDNKLYYPVIGNNVVMYANSSVLGNSNIGNNVIISANSYLINENIPSNCIVFGQSPNICIKRKNEEEIKMMTKAFWKWQTKNIQTN